VNLKRGRPKKETTFKPSLRCRVSKWASLQERFPKEINHRFNLWIEADCPLPFSEQESEDLKQGLYFAVKALDQGNSADVTLANRLELINKKLEEK